MADVRVLLADDHTLVRESLVKTVNAEPGFEVVAEATKGTEVLSLVTSHQPDVVVLDMAMPEMDGLTVASQLKEHAPDVKILFMTMHDDDMHLKRAMALEVAGFVSKRASADEFIEALQAVSAGEQYLSTEAMRRVMGMAAGRGSSGPQLSPREEEILFCLVDGKRPADIAAELFLSIKTVKNHLSSVYLKLGVETAAQAVAKAYKMGLVRSTGDVAE